jgi:biopolymer transport protein ExbB/TolQ
VIALVVIERAVIEPVKIIPWWGWLLIWVGLVLALLVMLAAGAWWLLRKGMGVLDAAAELAEATAVLEVDDSGLPRQQRAVLAELRDIHRREDARRAHRTERRRLRHERRMARARRITRVDATTVRWPDDWYRETT